MARQVNGFVGTFNSLTELNRKFPPAEHAGCSANFTINGTTVKYWSNGTNWAGGDSLVLQNLATGVGILPDGVALYDVTTTNNVNCAINSATASFSILDIGKPCVIIPYTDTGLFPSYGTITTIISTNQCIATLNVAPGSLASATMIYGTDNGARLDALFSAFTSAPSKGMVQLPSGIICTTRTHNIPTGIYLRGLGNNPTGGKAKDFKHYGTSLCLVGYLNSDFLTGGSIGPGDPKGIHIRDLNIDCANLAYRCLNSASTGRTEHIEQVTMVRGNSTEIYNSAATSRVHKSCFLGQNNGNVVSLSGDSTFVNNIVTGAGNSFYGIKTSNGDDVLIAHNHIWKDSSATSMLGGSIWASFNSGNTKAGSVVILGNKCDTNYGSAIKISVSGASSARDVAILNNDCFNNDSVTNNTGPVIELNVASGCDIRGLRIQGNGARASWNDPTKGQWTYLIDNSASLGTIYGSWVGGNVAHGVTGLYNGFTPTMDGGNLIIAGSGTTVTKSTIA